MAPSADATPPGPAPKSRIWLLRVLTESLLIVFSVLVALAVDEWREGRQRAERAEAAAHSVRSELRENVQIVERARANHLAMRDSLRVYAARGQPPPPKVYLNGIFNPGLVHSTAWESARETGATAEMPYPLVLVLSRTYDRQARYRTLSDALVQDLMGQIRREGMETVLRDGSASFIPLQEDFVNRESVLLRAYDRALVELDRRMP